MNFNFDQEQPNPEWYDKFLTDYDYQSPRSGQVLEGTVVRNDEDGMIVDVGLKRDAIVSTRDLSLVGNDALSEISVGDQVMVVVSSPFSGNNDLLVSLSKGIELKAWKQAESSLNNGTIHCQEIVGYNRGGLLIQFENLRGFLPFSLVPEIQAIRNPKRVEKAKINMVGSQIEVKIIEVVPERNRLIFSAMAALEEKRKESLRALEIGRIINGSVVSIVDFGIFVNIGEIDGLVHISQLDWKKIKHPSEIYSVGDEIQVKVFSVDLERQRVSLSRKALLPSPWETVAENIHPGDYIEGRATRIVDFGAFIALEEGIEGLIHVSQIGYSSSQNPQDAIRPGDTVLLKVLEVNPDRKRIALSMRQVPLERQIAWAMENIGENESPVVAAVVEQETLERSETIEPPIQDEPAELPAEEIIHEDISYISSLTPEAGDDHGVDPNEEATIQEIEEPYKQEMDILNNAELTINPAIPDSHVTEKIEEGNDTSIQEVI